MTEAVKRDDGAGPLVVTSGQVWRHHTTGDYRVFGINPGDGRVRLCRVDTGQAAAEVWSDYLRANFTLAGAASPMGEANKHNKEG